MNQTPTFGEWGHPRCPFVIEYSAEAMERIRRHVLEAFYSVPRGGAEAGGVLFGRRSERRIRILAAAPAACQHLSGPSFILSSEDERALATMLRSGWSDGIPGLQPLGWYHSQTRQELSLSGSDVELWHRFFPEAWQVALVVRPTSLNVTRAAFFFREADGSVRTRSSYAEVDLFTAPAAIAESPPELPELILQRRLPEPPPPEARRPEPLAESLPVPMPLEPAPAAPAPEPETPRPAAPKFITEPARRGWAWTAGIVVLVAGVGFFAGRELLTPMGVQLRLERRGSQWLVKWNPGAAAVEAATTGALHVEDGNSNSAIVLDRPRLAAGTAPVEPRSPHLQVRLILRQPNGETVVESTASDR
jgi:proteasome lid subunit RPN8/RPN11